MNRKLMWNKKIKRKLKLNLPQKYTRFNRIQIKFNKKQRKMLSQRQKLKSKFIKMQISHKK